MVKDEYTEFTIDNLIKEIKQLQIKIDELESKLNETEKFEFSEAKSELIKLSAAVQQSPSIVVITDSKGEIQYVNPKFIELTGYSKEDLIGLKASVLKSGKQSEDFYSNLWRTISVGGIWHGKFLNKKKNGELFWESASISPIFDSKNDIINYIKVAEDITQTKRIEDTQKILLNISKTANQYNSLYSLLEAIHQKIKLVLRAENFYVGLYNKDDNTYSFPYHIDEFDSIELNKHYNFSNGFTDYVFKANKSLIITPKCQIEIEKKGIIKGYGDDLSVWLGVPLKASENDMPIGVVAIQDYKNFSSYTESDKDLLEIIAYHIIGFIERIKYEQELISAKELAEHNEANISAIIEGTNNSIWAFDRSFNILYINKLFKNEFLRAFGVELEKGMSLIEALPKPLQPIWKSRCIKVFANEQFTIEDAVPTNIGTIYIEVTFNPIIKNGEIIGASCFGSDITFRKNAEMELRENEKKLRNLTENSTNMFYQHTTDHLLTYLSPQIKDILGYTVDEAKIKWTDLTTENPINIVGFENTVEAIKTGKTQPPYHLELFHKSRRKVWVEVREAPLLEDGKVVGIVGALTDITKEKIALDALKEREESLARLVDNIPYAFFANDFDGNIVLVNRKASEYTGYSKNELLSMKVADIDHESVIRNDQEQIYKKLKNIVTQKFQSTHIRKDGSTYPVELKLTLFEFKNQPIILAVAQDITERLKAENYLKESEAKIRGMFKNTQTGLLFCNPEGIIIEINEAVANILGAPSAEATKQINLLTFKPLIDSGFSIQLQEAINSRKTITGEIEYKPKWDVTVFMRYQLIPLIINNQLLGIWVNLNNLTDLWKTQQELLKAKEKAEESDRLKSAFLANMSHEIRTPMNGILGFTNLLKSSRLSGDDRKEYIKIIEKSGNRMLNTINDIVDISKIEAGQVEIYKTAVNINEVVDSQISFFKNEANQKGIILSYTTELSNPKFTVETDKYKLESIFTNLIKNAIKYTEKGEINISCAIRHKNEKSFLEFIVKDSGIGIPQHRLEAIFNRFEQADIEDKRALQGSGLGLAITKSYVEMLGGQIKVESKPGIGSKFIFSIQVDNVELRESISLSQGNKEKQPNCPEDYVLIIAEDDEVSRIYLETIMKKYFGRIFFTNNGEQTIQCLKDNPETKLILMDLKMPGLDGLTATSEIRKFNQKVIIIAQTAYGLEGDKTKAINAGCDNYIAKPINKTHLIEMLNKYLV